MPNPPIRSKQSNLRPSEVSLDLHIFSVAAKEGEVALELAVSILEGHLLNPAVHKETVVRELLSVDGLFPLIFSVMSFDAVATFTAWVSDTFPTTAEDFKESIAKQLLDGLSLFFWALGYPQEGLKHRHQSIKLTLAVLQCLPSLFTPEVCPSPTTPTEIPVAIKGKSQRDAKKQRARRNKQPTMVVDPTPFQALGVGIPASVSELLELTTLLLVSQLQILQDYLHILRDPNLAADIRQAYSGPASVEHDRTTEDNPVSNDTCDDADTVTSATLDTGETGVYPQIQPLQAALHFDSVEGFGDWRIIITSSADSDLRVMKSKKPVLFDIVLKKISELSHGHFSKDNQKQLGSAGSDIHIPIYEAKMTHDSRLIYQVDCVKEYGDQFERQVLRIFGVYKHTEIERRRAFWAKVSNQLGGQGAEYRRRCTYRNAPLNSGDNVIPPASWPPRQDEQKTLVHLPSSQDDDNFELHSLLVLDKMIPLSQALLKGILADRNVAPVYLLSPEEQEVIHHTSSCYVLGRSGTGKTTTILFKIFGIERAWEQSREQSQDIIPKPRQVFVTASQYLASKVADTYSKLSQLLAIERPDADSSKVANNRQRTVQSLVNMDEDSRYSSGLPPSFSELEDTHFPLFITYRKLCDLLEAEFKHGQATVHDPVPVHSDVWSPRPSADETTQADHQPFVSFLVFLRAYWKHFGREIKKSLDPSQVFAEFMGVIKGSEHALQTSGGYLKRDEYCKLSVRIGTFADERETVYDLFEVYLKVKRRRGEYDAADRTYKIFCGLRKGGLAGKKVDYIYVDEVQDNLLTDTFILRSICQNANGLFWAGDTAQTISAGSSFRFNELKAFQWRLERTGSSSRRSNNPKLFQLVKNYRSHGGIVKCAQSILELITHFWPDSVDQIVDETNSIPGRAPVFFASWGADLNWFDQFLFGDSDVQKEFGAEQCILVRDDLAKAKLRSQIGEAGLIFTIHDSKGLEFDDVLLYNFFEDSTASSAQWSVLLNKFPQSPLHSPAFDTTRYGGVCHELKQLYVAVTRARHNLWIVDRSDEHKPLQYIWETTQVVRVHQEGDALPRLATESTAEEWEQRGYELLHKDQYEEAVIAFRRAGLPRERNVANAYFLRQKAQALPLSNRFSSSRVQAFVSAGRAFSNCAVSADADTTRTFYLIAAECFVQGGDYANAGHTFLSAHDPTRGAQCYRKAGLFDAAVRVIQNPDHAIAPDIADGIMTVAKIHYISKDKLRKAIGLFSSVDEATQFMREYGFFQALIETLRKSNKLVEAAELQISRGLVADAIYLLLQDKGESSSFERAQQCLLDCLWRCAPLGATDSPVRSRLFQSLLRISRDFTNVSEHFQDSLSMFRAIASRRYASLKTLAERFYHFHQDKFSAVLCLDRYFAESLAIQRVTRAEVVSTLASFLIYVMELQKIAQNKAALSSVAVQRLLGFRPSADAPDSFTVEEWSLFGGSSTTRDLATASERPGHAIQVNELDMAERLKKRMFLYLHRVVQQEDQQCHSAEAFRPCPLFALLRSCPDRECSRGHNHPGTMGFDWFHDGVRIILQQILVLQTISTHGTRGEQLERKRFWLGRLSRTLYPPHRIMGSAAIFDRGFIPEAHQVFPIVQEWIRDVLQNLHDWIDPLSAKFLTCIAEVGRLAYLFDEGSAREYVPRMAIVNACSEPKLLRSGRFSIVSELLGFLDGSSYHAISKGILSFTFICQQRLAIDVNVLCHILDLICCSIFRHRAHHAYAHNLTLPSSWLLSLSGGERPMRQSIDLRSLVIDKIPGLLAHVRCASDHLWFEGRQLRHSHIKKRDIFVFRICQSVSLLGYNTWWDPKAQPSIHAALTSLAANVYDRSPSFPRIYSWYVSAHSFQGVVHAMRDSEQNYGTPLDPLIQLKDARRVEDPHSVHVPRGTQLLIFDNPSDINSMLLTRIPKTSKPVTDFVIQDTLDEGEPGYDVDVDRDEDSRPASPIDEELLQEHTDSHGPADIEAATSLVDGTDALPSAPAPTNAEIAAAEVIQTAYRYYRWCRASQRRGLAKARERWFLKCHEISGTVPLAAEYRRLFLGALPHLLVCLDEAAKYTQEIQKNVRVKLHGANHDQYEELHKTLHQALSTHKDVLKFLELLKPTSALHRQSHARQSLRQCTTEVATFMQELPRAVSGEWAWDLEMVIHAVMYESPESAMKASMKPRLGSVD